MWQFNSFTVLVVVKEWVSLETAWSESGPGLQKGRAELGLAVMVAGSSP